MHAMTVLSRAIGRAATAGLLAATIALPTSAFAQSDSKILPATVCQVWGPFEENLPAATVAEIHTSIRYTEQGRVENWHPTYAIGVVCPIIRDTVERPLDWLTVTFRDNYPGTGANNRGLLRCWIRANNREGTGSVAYDYDDSESENGDSPDPDGVFDFEHMTLDSAATDGSYTLTCVIPPVRYGLKSFIGSIRYQEP